MGRRFAGIMVWLLLAATTAGAEIYHRIGGNGAGTFKDDPAPGQHEWKVAAAATAEPRETQRFSGTVEIYLTSWCGYCKQAVKYMTSRGIPFAAYDVEKDPAAKQRFKELGGRGVPLIVIGSNKMAGFSPDVLEYYLNNSR